MTPNRGRSIIFYPRSYNTRGETKKHSMLGVTESGKLINVKLRLDEKHEGKENAPSIKEFSKTDYLAKNPCIASDENSPDNSEGVLLLSRCIKDTFDSDKGVEVYIARWASVLSPSSQTPPLHRGIGRMEIKKDSSTVKKLSGLMRKAESDNRLDDADTLKAQVKDPVNWSYPAIFYYPELMVTFSLDNCKEIEEKLTSSLDKLSKSGIVSGIAVRARNRSNEVVKETYREIFSKFIISETRYQDGKETFDSIVKDLKEKHKDKGFKWDAIPVKKINTGPSSSRFYGKEDKLSFTRSMFTFDGNDEEPRLSKICARVSYFGDTDNTLLSRLYTLSEPLEHPARLDKSGHFSLTFTGEGTKLAHLPVDDESIVQIKDGLSENLKLINRAFWLLEGNAPIIRIKEDNENSNIDENKENNNFEDHEDSGSIASISNDTDEVKTEIDKPNNQTQISSCDEDMEESDSPEEKCSLVDESIRDDSFFELSEVETESEEIERKDYEEQEIDSYEDEDSNKDTQPIKENEESTDKLSDGSNHDLDIIKTKDNLEVEKRKSGDTEELPKIEADSKNPGKKGIDSKIKENEEKDIAKKKLTGMAASLLNRKK